MEVNVKLKFLTEFNCLRWSEICSKLQQQKTRGKESTKVRITQNYKKLEIKITKEIIDFYNYNFTVFRNKTDLVVQTCKKNEL